MQGQLRAEPLLLGHRQGAQGNQRHVQEGPQGHHQRGVEVRAQSEWRGRRPREGRVRVSIHQIQVRHCTICEVLHKNQKIYL